MRTSELELTWRIETTPSLSPKEKRLFLDEITGFRAPIFSVSVALQILESEVMDAGETERERVRWALLDLLDGHAPF